MPGTSHLERQNGINNNTAGKEWKRFGGKGSVHTLVFPLSFSSIYLNRECELYNERNINTDTGNVADASR